MADPRFILFCNNRIAVPAIIELAFHGQLAAVLVPAHNKEVMADIQDILKNSTVPLLSVTGKTLREEVLRLVKETAATAGLLMTFPYKLKPVVFQAPPKGFFNFHYGVLPQYRGPEPIFSQLKNGEKMAGLTIHIIDDTIDGGPVVMEEKIRIEPEDTYGIVQTKLAYLGAKLVNALVKTISFGSRIPSYKQDETKAVYHSRPSLQDVLINWAEMDAAAIRSLVNACNPWNKGAGTRVNNYMIGILEVEIIGETAEGNITPGTIVSLNSGGLLIATKDEKLLKAGIIFSPEGFMSGERLGYLGVKQGDRFI